MHGQGEVKITASSLHLFTEKLLVKRHSQGGGQRECCPSRVKIDKFFKFWTFFTTWGGQQKICFSGGGAMCCNVLPLHFFPSAWKKKIWEKRKGISNEKKGQIWLIFQFFSTMGGLKKWKHGYNNFNITHNHSDTKNTATTNAKNATYLAVCSTHSATPKTLPTLLFARPTPQHQKRDLPCCLFDPLRDIAFSLRR